MRLNKAKNLSQGTTAVKVEYTEPEHKINAAHIFTSNTVRGHILESRVAIKGWQPLWFILNNYEEFGCLMEETRK